ncbi:MAG: ABC transporter ATP-binding protein [Oscillospiraceae bacterium]|nr:ABC transporter ATP-binding protein [Oscillospiraceae bacterium]
MFKGLIFFIRQGWQYDKRYVLWRVLYQFVNSAIPLAAILVPKYIIDELMGQQRAGRIIWLAAALAGYTLAATALSHYLSWDGFTRRCRVSAEFDSELHRRLAQCDYERLESPEFLDMQQKAKKFLYCDWHGFGYLLDCALNIVGQAITAAGIIGIIAGLNLWIVLLFIALSAVSALFSSKAKRKAFDLSEQITADQRSWVHCASLFEDRVCGKEIRLNNMGGMLLDWERRCFTRINRNLKQQNDAFIGAGVLDAALVCVRQCAAYGYLIREVLRGTVSIGSFTMYVSAVTAFGSALGAIMDSLAEIRAYDFYYDRLEAYLNLPAKLRDGTEKPSAGPHTIEFRHVSYRYPGSEGYALRDVNITLTPGQKLLIVGENGAGKSTFVKLLLRLYDPAEGEILLDGTDIRRIDYDRYMELFAAVFQDHRLFSMSIRENVALARPADGERIETLLRQAGFGEKLDSLPEGLDTAVTKIFDEEGFEPSGGEAQKIAIARALYRDAPVVVLDEPTAALDPWAEYELYQNFSAMTGGKTAVYISHRMAGAKFCDTVAVFENGTVTEHGTHAELMELGGKYAEL